MSDVEQTDVLVIGAGIHGAGVAQVVAAAGYRVTVLEQSEVAAATSSRSSKLIHGGLRYLETFQFRLVRKALLERQRLLNNAPRLVKLVPFYVPVYRQTQRRPWILRIGLSLYALLGGLGETVRFKTVKKTDWPVLAIKQQGLQTVFQYWDAQTDDAALTRAVMDSAQQLGAELRCPARMTAAVKNNDHWLVGYTQGNSSHQIRSRLIVNASGAWVNRVLAVIDPAANGRAIDLVQGAHIVLANPAPEGVFYVEAPQDRRAVFIMPWKGNMLVGTTETHFEGDPSRVEASQQEIDYLLEVFRFYFPHLSDNVIETMAGLRVLPKQVGSHFHRPRDTVIHHEPDGVFTLYGGKLTGYRATAEEVMQKLAPWLPQGKKVADTRELRI